LTHDAVRGRIRQPQEGVESPSVLVAQTRPVVHRRSSAVYLVGPAHVVPSEG
jgi:hypothetical protein